MLGGYAPITVTQISLKLLHIIFLQWYTSRTSKSTCDQETSDVCWSSQNRTRRSCPQFFIQKQVQITSLVHRHPVYSKAKDSGFTKVCRFEYSDTLTVYTTAVWRQIFAGLSNQGGGLWSSGVCYEVDRRVFSLKYTVHPSRFQLLAKENQE
jgi:hypothetical protein